LLFGVTFSFHSCKDEPTTTPTVPTVKNDFLASTIESNRNAILEYFVGVRNTTTIDGHVKAKDILDANKGKAFCIAIHAGSFAHPSSGWANFTTTYGQTFIDQSGVSGYPAGLMNRIKAEDLGCTAQKNGGLAMERTEWAKGCAAILKQISYVNVGSKADYDSISRELTVKVDLYYTSDASEENNLNIAFLQDGVVAEQSGGGTTYEHNHILRHLITGQWGEVVPLASTKKTSKFTKTYKYVVPQNFNGSTIPPGGGDVKIEDCKIVIFVSEGKTNIVTGIEIPVTVK